MSDQPRIQNEYGDFTKLLVIGLLIAISIVFGIGYFENINMASVTSVQNTPTGSNTGDMMRVVSGDAGGPPPNTGGVPPAGAPL